MKTKLLSFQRFSQQLLPHEARYLSQIQAFHDVENQQIIQKLLLKATEPSQHVQFDESIDKRKYSRIKKWVQEKLNAIDVDQEFACQVQAVRHVEAAVEVWVVDQYHPADGRARLLEIHTHGPHQTVGELALKLGLLVGVLHRGLRIVDRAGPEDHQQPGIVAAEDRFDRAPSVEDGLPGLVGQGQRLLQLARGAQRVERSDVEVLRRPGLGRGGIGVRGGRGVHGESAMIPKNREELGKVATVLLRSDSRGFG